MENEINFESLDSQKFKTLSELETQAIIGGARFWGWGANGPSITWASNTEGYSVTSQHFTYYVLWIGVSGGEVGDNGGSDI